MRKMKIRGNEHICDTCKEVDDQKPLAKHIIEENHTLGPITLLKEVRKPSQLDTYESMYLFKARNQELLNIQVQGNNPSILFKFL